MTSRKFQEIGIEQRKVFNGMLARAKKYILYEERLNKNMGIYGGGPEKGDGRKLSFTDMKCDGDKRSARKIS